MTPVTSVSKGCCGHQRISHCRNSQLRGFRMEKNRLLALEGWGANQRNDFNEPRLLCLPMYWKALNSLIWDACSSLINVVFAILTPFFFCISTYAFWLLPYSLHDSPSELSKELPPRLRSSANPSNKTYFSTFRLCFFPPLDTAEVICGLIRVLFHLEPFKFTYTISSESIKSFTDMMWLHLNVYNIFSLRP